VLLALLPVAGYFIVPLVWKKGPSKSPGSVAILPTAQIAAPPAVVKEAATATEWFKVAAQIAKDTKMKPAPAQGVRNPFHLAIAKTDTAIVEMSDSASNKSTRKADRELTVEDLGLRLTSTIVGDRIRMATINGKPYRENARIALSRSREVAADPSQPLNEPMLVLKSVDRKFVVLEHEGKLFRLPLSR
jgi:hypothetical protein